MNYPKYKKNKFYEKPGIEPETSWLVVRASDYYETKLIIIVITINNTSVVT